MTGRVVDSYTNIDGEAVLAQFPRRGLRPRKHGKLLTTVHGQMRLASVQNILLSTLNSADLQRDGAGAMAVVLQAKVGGGRRCRRRAAGAAAGQHVALDHVGIASLFENIGTVRDGIGSLALPRMVTDARGAAVEDRPRRR